MSFSISMILSASCLDSPQLIHSYTRVAYGRSVSRRSGISGHGYQMYLTMCRHGSSFLVSDHDYWFSNHLHHLALSRPTRIHISSLFFSLWFRIGNCIIKLHNPCALQLCCCCYWSIDKIGQTRTCQPVFKNFISHCKEKNWNDLFWQSETVISWSLLFQFALCTWNSIHYMNVQYEHCKSWKNERTVTITALALLWSQCGRIIWILFFFFVLFCFVSFSFI